MYEIMKQKNNESVAYSYNNTLAGTVFRHISGRERVI